MRSFRTEDVADLQRDANASEALKQFQLWWAFESACARQGQVRTAEVSAGATKFSSQRPWTLSRFLSQTGSVRRTFIELREEDHIFRRNPSHFLMPQAVLHPNGLFFDEATTDLEYSASALPRSCTPFAAPGVALCETLQNTSSFPNTAAVAAQNWPFPTSSSLHIRPSYPMYDPHSFFFPMGLCCLPVSVPSVQPLFTPAGFFDGSCYWPSSLAAPSVCPPSATGGVLAPSMYLDRTLASAYYQSNNDHLLESLEPPPESSEFPVALERLENADSALLNSPAASSSLLEHHVQQTSAQASQKPPQDHEHVGRRASGSLQGERSTSAETVLFNSIPRPWKPMDRQRTSATNALPCQLLSRAFETQKPGARYRPRTYSSALDTRAQLAPKFIDAAAAQPEITSAESVTRYRNVVSRDKTNGQQLSAFHSRVPRHGRRQQPRYVGSRPQPSSFTLHNQPSPSANFYRHPPTHDRRRRHGSGLFLRSHRPADVRGAAPAASTAQTPKSTPPSVPRPDGEEVKAEASLADKPQVQQSHFTPSTSISSFSHVNKESSSQTVIVPATITTEEEKEQ